MRRFVVLAGLAAAMALPGTLAGCTRDAKAEVPTVGAPSTPPTSASGPATAELRFVACMRQQGIADMPDPIPGDTSGHSAVRYALDVLGKGSDDAFQAALDKCQNLLPTVEVSTPPGTAQQQRDLAFAKCMRDHGVTDFPDDIPYSNGAAAIWFVESPDDPDQVLVTGRHIGVNLGKPIVKSAFDACVAAWLKTSS